MDNNPSIQPASGINKVLNRLRDNSRGFWPAFRVPIIIFTIAISCDAVSTWHFLCISGHLEEANPFIQIAIACLTPLPAMVFMVLGKFVAACLVAIYLRRWALYIFTVAAFLGFFAAWYNTWGVHTGYTPRILYFLVWLTGQA